MLINYFSSILGKEDEIQICQTRCESFMIEKGSFCLKSLEWIRYFIIIINIILVQNGT